MSQLWITLKYSIRLLLHPIVTTGEIIQERNQRASYFAVWITLLTMIINSVLLLQSLRHSIAKYNIAASSSQFLQFAVVFVFVPISFFLGRFLFLVFTKGGLRILNRKFYPKSNQERTYLSHTLRLMYPYFYIPTAYEMLLLLVSYPSSEAFQSFLSTVVFIYTMVIQIVSIKRIYHVSGAVAFFAPIIVFFVGIVIFMLIWLLTTGAVGILSNLT